MHKSKKIKAIISFIFLFAVITFFAGSVYATSPIDDPTQYLPTNTPTIPTNMSNMVKVIITIIQAAGVVIAVVCIMVIGIQYMVGAAEQKAEYKKTAIAFLIGALLLFSSATIVKIIYSSTTEVTQSK